MVNEVFDSCSVVQVVTVNCARIIHGNQVATNGVVHVIDRVISAVGNTIQDVLDIEEDLSSLNVSDCLSQSTEMSLYKRMVLWIDYLKYHLGFPRVHICFYYVPNVYHGFLNGFLDIQ